MDPTDTQSPHALTDEQIEHLALAVLDDFGPSLSKTRFADAVLMLLEDVAGLEVVSRKQRVRVLRLVWRRYRRTRAL